MRNLLSILIALPLLAQTPAAPAAAEEAKPQTQAAPAADPAAAPAAGEDWLTGTLDVGYRFLSDVRGDFNAYRSVVNLGEGPKLLNADFTIQPLNRHYVDRIDVHANSWGGDPYNTFRLDARRQGWYRFTFDYRNIAYYNFLPSFANPGTANSALPFLNQYGFDTHRRVANTQLELFPGSRIVPYVAYSRSGGRGDGTSNFVFDANEYTVPTRYSDHTNEVRAGVRFEYKRWHATLEGGGMNFRDDQELSQSPTLTNLGNVRTRFFDEQLFLTSGHDQYGIRGSGAFTRAIFTANPVAWADVAAQFLYSRPKTDVHFSRVATGNIFDFATTAFYTSALLDTTGTARQPNPSGNVSLTLKPFGGRLRILESWMTNRLHTAGSLLLLDQLLTDGATPNQEALAQAARFVANYNQQELNVLFDATSFLTLRGGHRYVWGDTTAPATFLIQGQGIETERGTLRRNVGLAGVTVRAPSDIRINVDFEGSPGDRAYFRTSLNEYRKARISVRWQPLPTLQFTGRADVLKNENPDPLIRYDFLSRNNTLTAYWTPVAWKGFGLLADYTRSTLRSEILYLIPSQLTSDFSLYRENAHTGTLLADIPLPISGAHSPALNFGGSFYRSQGTRPVRFWQPMARLTLPICAHVQFNTEWRWYALSQPFYQYEGFRSHQFVTGLRFTR